MAGRPRSIKHRYVESEESDPASSHQSHSVPIIEDLLYEIDVARYYEKMLNVNLPGIHRTAMKSRAVQTEADVSGIPPSWLKAQGMLVNEIHTSIGNLINSLFHSPGGSQGLVQDCERLKFFKYVDGLWKSKYFPHVRIPASEIQRRIYSGRLENDLQQIFECAQKLKNITSCLVDHDCDTPGEDPKRTVREKLWNEQASLNKHSIASTSGNYDQHFDIVMSGSSSSSSLGRERAVNSENVACAVHVEHAGCRSKIPHRLTHTRSCNLHEILSVPKTSAYKSSKSVGESIESCINVNGCIVKGEVGSNRTRMPLTTIAESASSRADQCVGPKTTLYNAAGQQGRNKENCTRSVSQPGHKNFIKRNIMAVGEPVIRPRANSQRARFHGMNI